VNEKELVKGADKPMAEVTRPSPRHLGSLWSRAASQTRFLTLS
jgi:hypothetical protein